MLLDLSLPPKPCLLHISFFLPSMSAHIWDPGILYFFFCLCLGIQKGLCGLSQGLSQLCLIADELLCSLAGIASALGESAWLEERSAALCYVPGCSQSIAYECSWAR